MELQFRQRTGNRSVSQVNLLPGRPNSQSLVLRRTQTAMACRSHVNRQCWQRSEFCRNSTRGIGQHRRRIASSDFVACNPQYLFYRFGCSVYRLGCYPSCRACARLCYQRYGFAGNCPNSGLACPLCPTWNCRGDKTIPRSSSPRNSQYFYAFRNIVIVNLDHFPKHNNFFSVLEKKRVLCEVRTEF